jgi:hypothetical protein
MAIRHLIASIIKFTFNPRDISFENRRIRKLTPQIYINKSKRTSPLFNRDCKNRLGFDFFLNPHITLSSTHVIAQLLFAPTFKSRAKCINVCKNNFPSLFATYGSELRSTTDALRRYWLHRRRSNEEVSPLRSPPKTLKCGKNEKAVLKKVTKKSTNHDQTQILWQHVLLKC